MSTNNDFYDAEYLDEENKAEFNNKRLSINQKRRNARRKLEKFLEKKKLQSTLDGYDYFDMK